MPTENQNTPFLATQRNWTGYATLAEADATILYKYAGLTIYDISTDTFYYWTGSYWSALLTSGGGGTTSWGSILGLLSNQTDLQAALNAKQDLITLGTTAQYFRGDLSLATFPTALSAFTNDPGFITSSALTPLQTQINQLLNNVYKVTYYEIITGTSGSVSLPTGATLNANEFGLSDDAILSKVDGSNKPTFESPKTAGGVVVTAALNTVTGAYLTSGVYTDSSVALIYSINITAANYSNLNSFYIIESDELDGNKTYLAPLSYTNSTDTVSISQASSSTDGYLSSTDWNTFNNKQPAGNYITALTGDVSASGPGSVTATLASIITASTKGAADKSLTITYDAKGRLTSVSEQSIQVTEAQVTGLPEDIQLLYNDSTTGIITFGGLAINSGDNTKFDVGAITAWFIDETTPTAPTKTKATFGAQTAITVTNLAIQNVTYVAINSSGTIIQSSTPFRADQHRTLIRLGVIVHSSRTIINAVNNQPKTIISPLDQLNDFMESLGPFSINGNTISANGSNLSINKSVGELFKAGANYTTNTYDPHTVTLAALTAPTNMRYRLRDGTEYSNTAFVDPNNYDASGVLTAVPDTKYTIHRFYIFQSNLIRIQYGQNYYDSIDDAKAGIVSSNFVTEQNLRENGLLLCALIVRKGCTDLTNTDQAAFVSIGRFGIPNETNTGTGLFRKQTLNDSSTGLITGGALSIASGSQINIAAGRGIIVNNTTDPANPTLTEVSWGAFSNVTLTTLSNPGTAIFVNSAGAVIQMNISNLPSGTDVRDKIFLGAVGHPTGVVSSVFNIPQNLVSPLAQLNDFTSAIGPFTISGNKITKNTGALTLNKSAGRSYHHNSNFQVDKTNPSTLTTAALFAPTLSYVKQDGFLGFVSSSISTTQYDNAGTLTTTPGGKFMTHRIWHQPSNNILFFQYSQTFYDSMALARAGFGIEDFIVPAPLEFGAYLVAVIIVKQNEANLDNTNNSDIIPQGKFAGTGSGNGNADTLQTAYTNSSITEILTDSTRGAVTIQRGSAADTDNVLEIKNGAGTTTMYVTGNGSIFVANHSVTPTAPSGGFKLFADSSNRFNWIGTNGFSRTFDGIANTANRVYTLQDKSGTIAHLDDITGSGTTELAAVISQTNTPPGSPTTGDRYLVGMSPTGAWVGFANNIAEWNGSSWTFTAPVTNNTVFVTATLTTLRYNGTSWVAYNGTAVLHNGNTLAANLVIGTNDNYDIYFKRNNVNKAFIDTNGLNVLGTSGSYAMANAGILNVTNNANSSTRLNINNSLNSTAGLTELTLTHNSSHFGILRRYNVGTTGNYTGTSLALSGTYLMQNSLLGIVIKTGNNPDYIANIIGVTSTNAGSVLDATGLRVDNISNLHTANLNKFTVNGKSSLGANNTATALLDIAASATANASLRLRAGVAPTTPNNGDIWNDGTYVVSQQAYSSKAYTGTTNRFVQADTAGNLTATTDIIDAYLTAGATTTLLDTTSNWDGATYTGTPITGTYQGQMWDNTSYWFTATADNVWIRLPKATQTYAAKTANYTIVATDNVIDCTANTFTVTLPTAVGIKGKNYIIKNSGTGVITLNTTSSQTIDGSLTVTLYKGNFVRVVSDNSNWVIIG